jgi:ankyrin repeat protein
MKLGADLEAKNHSGETALMVASRSQNWKAVETLLLHGVEVNARNNFHATALIIASATRSYTDIDRINRLETVRT